MKKMMAVAVLCGAVMACGCATQRLVKFTVPQRIVVNEGATVACTFKTWGPVSDVQFRIAGIDTNGLEVTK